MGRSASTLFPAAPCALAAALFTYAGCTASTPVMPRENPRFDQLVFEQAKKDFEAFVYGAHARGWFPSAAMGVVVGDKLVYELAIRADRDRQYHVASITKTVTATAVMQLVERGQIGLDQTVGELLPGVELERPELGWPKATVRNLLNHSSGLPDMRFYSSTEFVDQKTVPFPVPKIIYPPGKHFRYANHGFLLLGEILKRRSGMTLEEYMRHNVYQPAGMTNTNGPITGAGGVRTTLHDLANFAITHLNNGTAPGEHEVLRADTARSMLEPQTYLPFSGRVKYQGLGWRAEKNERGVTTYYHVGGDNYVAAWIQMFPQQHAAIMYLADPPEYFPALHDFLTSLQKRLGDLATILTNAPRPVYDLDAGLPPAELSQMYSGIYKHALSGRELEMDWKPDGITLIEKDTRRSYSLRQDTAHVFLGGPIYDAHDFLVQPISNDVMGMADVDGYYARVAPLPPRDTRVSLP